MNEESIVIQSSDSTDTSSPTTKATAQANGAAATDGAAETPVKPKRVTRARTTTTTTKTPRKTAKSAKAAEATDTPAPPAPVESTSDAVPVAEPRQTAAEMPSSAAPVNFQSQQAENHVVNGTGRSLDAAQDNTTTDYIPHAQQSGAPEVGNRSSADERAGDYENRAASTDGAREQGNASGGFSPSNGEVGGNTFYRENRHDGRGQDGRGQEGRGEARPLPNRDERALENRGLRFRGRDGRTELRGRNDNRNFRVRGDNRPDNRGGDSRPEAPHRGEQRHDNWRNDADGGNGRLMPRDNRQNQNRDNREPREPRDNGRDAALEARLTERDVARGRSELDLPTLEEKNLPELREIARELGINAATTMKKNDLVFRILEAQAETSGNLFKKGILEILSDGKGFLRTTGYLPGDEDVYVSQSQIKRFNLKTGDTVSGQVRPPKDMERHYGLLRVEAIDGEPPEQMRQRKEFEKLTPIFPDDKFKLETSQENITARIIDLVSPIGKGQRGLIVAPPKAGKTTLIKNIANSIALNHPEVVLIVLLIDERPEEVTDISRSVKGEVVASTFDEMPENHMRVAEMVFEKAKRLVEQRKDVVILLDSITRLSRASNLVVTPSGRTLSGGLDPAAMYRPKRMFGAARNIEEGGSLTILATTLVDTGSRMDDMIFEEFKGTGNMDLVLDRNLFDQRVFPAIDINKSGTRRDDLLMSKEDLAATYHLRRTLSALDNDKAITLLIDRLKNTKTNGDFMQIVQKSARQGTQQS
jgi:transcription termination factor Rho